MPDWTDLHGPHLELMRAALGAASPRGSGVAVDLGCGAGGKTPWLAGACAPGALVIGLDRDRGALAEARAGAPGGLWLAADAMGLPLRPGAAGLIWCVAALGLFGDQGRALGEAAAALVPGGALVVAAAGERWVRRRRWPAGLAPDPTAPPPPADDLGADLAAALAGAGLAGVSLAAYLLEPPGLDPRAALLPLADLAPAAPLGVGEPEPLPVLLVARGLRPARAAERV